MHSTAKRNSRRTAMASKRSGSGTQRLNVSAEEFRQGSKKGARGMAQRSIAWIKAMHKAAEAAHPITGRGIGYKLFVAKLIASMARGDMARVYRLLLIAREQGFIPWEWIVDE